MPREIDPARVKVVQKAYDLRKKGKSYTSIERSLRHKDHNGAFAYSAVRRAEQLFGLLPDGLSTFKGSARASLMAREHPAPTPAEEWSKKFPRDKKPVQVSTGAAYDRIYAEVRTAVVTDLIHTCPRKP